MKLPPQMHTLEAIKPHKYGTRHLTAGEEYEASPRHAVALVAARKAKYAEKVALRAVEKTGAKMPEPEPTDVNIDDLRVQATQLGINVDGRWGVHRLRSEIEQAKSR